MSIFDDIPEADPETSKAVRKLVEERNALSERIKNLVLFPMDIEVEFNSDPDVVVGEDLTIRGKLNEAIDALVTNDINAGRHLLLHEQLHRASYVHVVLGGDPGIGKAFYREMREELCDPFYSIAPLEKQKPKPTWQDRRKQSQDAKAALIAKLKKKKR